MKIAVLLGDGMADVPLDELGGRTPLEIAPTPHMDSVAREGALGLAVTVPDGLPAGSDVANLSVFGFDPRTCYTGRAPLEAAAMGVALGGRDVAYRLNLVTLGGPDGASMEDFSAEHISTEEGRQIVETLSRSLGRDGIELYAGVSYRHLLVWRGGEADAETVPPHDIQGKPIRDFLPRGPGSDTLLKITEASRAILRDHSVNSARRDRGVRAANSVWLWGQGRAPRMQNYRERFGLEGAVVSAVDLLKGIGRASGLDPISVPGATGYLDTDYEGKVRAALGALRRSDFVYLHVEAPDETAHSGDLEGKVRAIADFDARVVGPMRRGIEELDESYAVLVMPDHPTPIPLRTHSRDPVPFALYVSTGSGVGCGRPFTEAEARATGLFVPEAHRLMDHILGRARLW